MTILWRPRPRASDWRFLKTWAAARPSLRAVSAVTGSILAMPRTPSVPKIFLGWLIGSFLLEGNHDLHVRRFRAHKRDARRRGNDHALAHAARRGFEVGQVHVRFDFLFLQPIQDFRAAADGDGDIIGLHFDFAHIR